MRISSLLYSFTFATACVACSGNADPNATVPTTTSVGAVESTHVAAATVAEKATVGAGTVHSRRGNAKPIQTNPINQ